MSYFLSIHSVTYIRDDGVAKQVGFLWAPNWTVLFVVFLPLFLRPSPIRSSHGRTQTTSGFLSAIGDDRQTGTWMLRVEASSHTY